MGGGRDFLARYRGYDKIGTAIVDLLPERKFGA